MVETQRCMANDAMTPWGAKDPQHALRLARDTHGEEKTVSDKHRYASAYYKRTRGWSVTRARGKEVCVVTTSASRVGSVPFSLLRIVDKQESGIDAKGTL